MSPIGRRHHGRSFLGLYDAPPVNAHTDVEPVEIREYLPGATADKTDETPVSLVQVSRLRGG